MIQGIFYSEDGLHSEYLNSFIYACRRNILTLTYLTNWPAGIIKPVPISLHRHTSNAASVDLLKTIFIKLT